MKQLALALTLTGLLSITSAQNDIFVPLPYTECNSCLDQAAASCPGDYRDASTGTCMCTGVGSTNTVTCVGVCDAADELGMGAGEKVVRSWYAYCILFFPELCAEAQAFTTPEYWEDRCGAGSGASTGDETDSGTEVAAPTAIVGIDPTGVKDNSPGAETEGSEAGTVATGTAVGATGTGSALSRPTAGAVPISIPGWGIMLGLGVMGLKSAQWVLECLA